MFFMSKTNEIEGTSGALPGLVPLAAMNIFNGDWKTP
jgi:hypothetical protein